MTGEPRELIEVIKVHVSELKQLFNGIDPSPFREQDLDPAAEEFIVEWAREVHRRSALALQVHVDRRSGTESQQASPGDAVNQDAALGDAVREYFSARAKATRGKLRLLFRNGRISLAIGIVCLVFAVWLGSLVEGWLTETRGANLVRESLLIGGWVAMWRPLETFLYDWWPVRAEARLYDRLSAMPVRITYGSDNT